MQILIKYYTFFLCLEQKTSHQNTHATSQGQGRIYCLPLDKFVLA